MDLTVGLMLMAGVAVGITTGFMVIEYIQIHSKASKGKVLPKKDKESTVEP